LVIPVASENEIKKAQFGSMYFGDFAAHTLSKMSQVKSMYLNPTRQEHQLNLGCYTTVQPLPGWIRFEIFVFFVFCFFYLTCTVVKKKADPTHSPYNLLSWNNFLRSLLCFVVIRSSHDEGLGRIIFRSVFRILQWQKEEEDDKRKKFLNSACKNVGSRSLGIYSQAFCRVFACVVIHTKRHTSLTLRFRVIHSVSTI
jgi:hypothetical protein